MAEAPPDLDPLKEKQMTPAMQQLLATSTPSLSDCGDGDTKDLPSLDSALFLKRWLLDLQLKVDAAEVAKHRMLKDALRLHIAETMQEALDSLIDIAAAELYEKLMAVKPTNGCAIPDEFEADPDPGDLPELPHEPD